MSAPTAQSVSAALRRAGLNPVGSSRQREGLRCSSSSGRVLVTADLDHPAAAARLSADAADALSERYHIERARPEAFYVSGVPRVCTRCTTPQPHMAGLCWLCGGELA